MDCMSNETEKAARDRSGSNVTSCFYCLGDRPSVHGELPDLVVLYITERATSVEEALREFEEYEKECGEDMRLNVIVHSDHVTYFESFT
jgi:hypothetical protein